MRHSQRRPNGQSGRFFREIGRPVATTGPSPPKPADLKREPISRAYGYWLGGPADNAAVGIPFG
jgi:hypothetical protein